MKLITITIVLVSFVTPLMAQETQTLFGPDTRMSFIWGVETQSTDIQSDIGTTIGLYGGALFNKTLLLGLGFGANMTHPTVNHGYMELIAQYTIKPENLIHYSGQLKLGRGTTKDYEQEKSSTMDNFANVTGPSFFYAEPVINAEFNFHENVRLVIGLGYRLVGGLDEDDVLISRTKVTNDEFSGLHLNVGVKVGKYSRISK